MADTLADLLTQAFTEQKKDRKDLTWRDVAREIGVAENSLLRWKEGAGMPGSMEQYEKLASFAGEDVYKFQRVKFEDVTNSDMRWFMVYGDDPNVAAVLAEARRKAEESRTGSRQYVNA
jgi:transcriptional regulator with XRE-family HTH domain